MDVEEIHGRESDHRGSARDRLEATLGRELAERLVAALSSEAHNRLEAALSPAFAARLAATLANERSKAVERDT